MPDYAVSVMPLISGVTVANECSHSDGTDVEDAWSLDGEAISSMLLQIQLQLHCTTWLCLQ